MESSTGHIFFRQIGALYGPGIMLSITTPFSRKDVESVFFSRFWLGQSVLIVGERNTSSSSWFVGTRGHMIEPDKKMRIYSASKMVSSTVIYAIMEDPSVQQVSTFSNMSRPRDILPWWNCSSGEFTGTEERCYDGLTVEKLLAFRSGLPSPGCENGNRVQGASDAEAWETCGRQLFAMPSADWAAAPRFDLFEYGTVGLFLAGLMAREARRQVAGHEQDEWVDLLNDYVIAPAAITDAPAWDEAYFSDGTFAYDYSGDENKGYALPEFPGLGGALACSPRQYAQFLSALLGGALVGAATLREMTRSHGSTDGFGSGMNFLAGYAQGMWHGPDGYVNSVGLQGYFPWLDQTAADPAEHLFGVLAQDAEPAFHDALKLGEAIGIPLTLVALALSARSILKARRARRMQATGRSGASAAAVAEKSAAAEV